MNVKKYKERINKEVPKMGVSMAILQPIKGKLAEEFLEKSEEAKISKSTVQKCIEMASKIKIK